MTATAAGGFRQTDFSGGLFEATASGDFTDRQLAKCYGMLLEGEVSIRSQPPVQQVGVLSQLRSLRTFRGRHRDWLLALDTYGQVFYTAAPGDDAKHETTVQIVWSPVPTAPVDLTQRFVCEVPAGNDDTEYKGAWLVNSLAGAGDAFTVGENAAGDGLVVLDRWADRYPSVTQDSKGDYIPDVNVMPHADLGVMWGDYLILGRVRWYRNADARTGGLSAASTKKYRNAIWVSATPQKKGGPAGPYQEFRIDQWHPLGVWSSLVPANADLLDMRVTDAGLLLLHSQGATLVRGNAPDNFHPDALTEIGGAHWDDDYDNARSTLWAETGATLWVNDRGAVWATNGADTGRQDQYLHLGEDARAKPTDQVCAVGPWLVLARAGRMFALRRFATDAAWTELNPGGGTPTSLCALGFCLYYLIDGQVYRMPFTTNTERGLVCGGTFPITVATATLGDPKNWDRKLWHRVGVVASAGTSTADAAVTSVTTYAGPALAAPAAAGYTAAVAAPLAQRTELVVPAGIGAQIEAAVEVVFTGDVRLEALFADVRGTHRSAR